MEKADAVAFAGRDWARLANLKAEHWVRLRAERGPGEGILVGDALRRQALKQDPGWPGEDDRRRDLETHVRVSAALRRAGLARHP